MLASLEKTTGFLKDPGSTVPQQPGFAQNQSRSARPEFLVLLGICTHLGCSPTYRPEPKSVDDNWEGGFYCSCHGSKFDLAGRVYRNMPAPINLEVPPYHFLDDKTLVIGDSGE
jgi:ubiquinol-cytochrome c reductase iron-sulfur subunit